jgi:citrate lyase subunit beta/citryl-CoA lyase
LPKVESADTLWHAQHLMHEQGSKAALWAMIETPRGVMQIDAIAAANGNLAVLVMGTNDLAKAMRVPQTAAREGFQYALSRCVLAARCHGLDILDGVHIHLNDDQGLRHACEQGLVLGFDGKTLIHPKQLEAANQVFAPSAAAVDAAQRMVSAWDAGGGQQGVMVIDGRLVEALHVEDARRTVALAALIAQRGA